MRHPSPVRKESFYVRLFRHTELLQDCLSQDLLDLLTAHQMRSFIEFIIDLFFIFEIDNALNSSSDSEYDTGRMYEN
jgi:hypothetical protein